MDANILAGKLQNTHLNNSPCWEDNLIFNPQADSGLSQDTLGDIPKYLFRIVSPLSDAQVDGTWIHSQAASQKSSSSLEDIFVDLNTKKRLTVARTLKKHLWWLSKDGVEDNFVSWTSSLLFALRYIYYRHLHSRDGSSLENIKLFVIDTERFSPRTFIQDLDLIKAFCEFDNPPPGEKSLRGLRELREDRGYYFGEYLSQGSLNLAGRCQMILASSLFHKDLLRRLQGNFKDINLPLPGNKEPRWPKEVRDFRKAVWLSTKPIRLSSEQILGRMEALSEIIDNFDPGWRFAMAVYFSALIGPETGDRGATPDNPVCVYLISKFIDQKDCESPTFRVIATDKMPELKQVEGLLYDIKKHFYAYGLKVAFNVIEEAERSLRNFHRTVFSEDQSPPLTTDSNKTLTADDRIRLSRFNMTRMLHELNTKFKSS
ncbi:predicted protein [Paecilomyces variotii No. 5]|uniref:DUF7587 domain-containing protein n=1 Tax=Byssochlamys spectabilis (strain No. 5 / NBRC 109023) TaxID=1356009 RepID=V5FJ77_BYSSN|nr:predicted protein [Paecilomyces variotii No. 5]